MAATSELEEESFQVENTAQGHHTFKAPVLVRIGHLT